MAEPETVTLTRAEHARLVGIVNEYNTTIRVVALLAKRLQVLTRRRDTRVRLEDLATAPDLIGTRTATEIIMTLGDEG